MKTIRLLLPEVKKSVWAALTLIGVSFSTLAVEVAPGDYEQYPAGATIGVVYYQHATTDSLRVHGREASSDFNLTSDIGILRLLHVYQLSDSVTIDPQFLLPFGHVSSGGDASALGNSSGTGDLILTAPIKFLLNSARDTFSLNAYLYVPTGSYDKDDPINLGENRWKVDFQTAYIKHFSDKWAMDLVGDAIWYGSNDDYGPGSDVLKQKTSYAAQLMGRYMPDPATSLGVGFGQTWGGEAEIDGADLDSAMRTTNFRLTATRFFTPKDQLQLQLGRDLSVENGPREDFRMNLRYARVF
ncbi:phenol degradation protein meta [Pseudomonas laurylsulfatiphila]|uniref:Phenol degradation protein meta n=2 Tax=Pseudomonas laurylsulfatiphila TaxID=2011015 RepID=A0A2S6FNR7_9PSED|nr:transporter [Pseudomonas laurylsulfatiphila]PPK39051.1 phenol degradation protein meta [Pseudomonas laurylsulfatiphila]